MIKTIFKIFIFVQLLSIVISHNRWHADPYQLNQEHSGGTQTYPTMCFFPDNTFVVAYLSAGAVVAQKFHKNGEQNEREIQVSRNLATVAENPSVICFKDYSFYVIYERVEPLGTGRFIYGQAVNDKLMLDGDELELLDTTGHEFKEVSIEMINVDEDYVITYLHNNAPLAIGLDLLWLQVYSKEHTKAVFTDVRVGNFDTFDEELLSMTRMFKLDGSDDGILLLYERNNLRYTKWITDDGNIAEDETLVSEKLRAIKGLHLGGHVMVFEEDDDVDFWRTDLTIQVMGTPPASVTTSKIMFTNYPYVPTIDNYMITEIGNNDVSVFWKVEGYLFCQHVYVEQLNGGASYDLRLIDGNEYVNRVPGSVNQAHAAVYQTVDTRGVSVLEI